VTDLQHLRGELLREAAALPADLTPERAAELLKSFALSAEQALERCGSAPIEIAAGDEFSPRAHRAVRRVPAASAEQDATVAAVVADGYQDVETGRVTTPARVHVYRWTAPESDDQSDGQAAEQENADA
jgi:molecular chaperone GrpE (heat shock protein)